MSYRWDCPATYLVFVPGLSLLIQKIQMKAVLPLPPFPKLNEAATFIEGSKRLDLASRKFINICKWHLRGSFVQAFILLSLANKTKKIALPILAIGISIFYELLDTTHKALKNKPAIYEFSTAGNIKNMFLVSAFNIF